MKKGTKIALAVGVVLLALGATLCNIAYGRGESVFARLKTGAELPLGGGVQSGYTVCRSGEESFEGDRLARLDIDWPSGSVTLASYDGDRLIVKEQAAASLTESQCLRWRITGGELSILSCADNQLRLPDKELSVLLPKSWVADGLELDGASAKISLSELTVAGEVKIDTASGAVSVTGLQCSRLDIDAASADLSLSRVECDRLELDTASGAVLSESLLCRKAEVDTASGAVRLVFAEAPGAVEVDTASGDVTLCFPKDTGLALDFDPGSGKLRGELVRGSLPVKVDTGSGNLTIEYR